MMRRCLSLAIVCAAALAVVGCKSKEQIEAEKNAIKAEQDKLQGKWKVASRTGEQQEDEDAPPPSSYYVIEGDIMKLVFLDKDGKEEVDSYKKMVITPGKTPTPVDLVYVDANGKEITARTSKRTKGKVKTSTTTLKDAAIYKLEGDKLTLCISWDEKNRPTDFTAPSKSSRYLLTLEKMKDGEKISATVDAPKPDAAKPDAPKPDASKPDAPKPDASKPDAPKPDAPKTNTKGTDK